MEFKKHCSTDSSIKLSQEEYEEQTKFVFFIHPKSDALECYSLEELHKWFDTQSKLYYWKNGANPQKRVYKLAHSGVWIDQEVYDFLFVNGHNVVFLFEKENVAIGSSFGVSQTHGAIHMIYSGMPMDPFVLKDITTLRATMSVFLPRTTKGLYSNLLPLPSIEAREESEIESRQENEEIEEIESIQGQQSETESEQQSEPLTEIILTRDDLPHPLELFDANTLIRDLDLVDTTEQLLRIERLSIERNRVYQVDLEWLQNLTFVSITYCHLKNTKGFSDLVYLEKLILWNNDITTIEELRNLPELRVLDLDHNQIKSIENIGLFKDDLPKLETIALRENEIEKITEDSLIDSFRSLTDIYLTPQKNNIVVENETLTFSVDDTGNFYRRV